MSKKVKITKLREVDNPLYPDNIPEGYERIGDFITAPEVGQKFYVGMGWRTSAVQEIIDEHTFRTLNGVYKWEVIEE